MIRTRLVASTATLAVVAAALAGCSAGTSASTPSSDLAVGSTDLSSVCPSTVVIQTNWNPEAEHGHLYQLLGDDYTADAASKSVSGPLMAGGEYTGVNVEIRAGGPAIGYQQVSTQMYSDDSITLGYVATDEAVQNSSTLPTVGVFAALQKSPNMIMWDPATYPQVKSIADLKGASAIVRYQTGAAYVDYLTQSGLLSPDQLDGSYDGTPASFVAAGGKDAQQGFASAEPYIYENLVGAWDRPVDYQLVYDTGWQPYEGTLAVRSDRLDELSPCLQKLVPVLQEANTDFLADPSKTIDLIVDLVQQYDNGWVYDKGLADYAVQTMKDQELAGSGSFDMDRVSDFIAKALPIYEAAGTSPTPDLKADAIVTNQFLTPGN